MSSATQKVNAIYGNAVIGNTRSGTMPIIERILITSIGIPSNTVMSDAHQIGRILPSTDLSPKACILRPGVAAKQMGRLRSKSRHMTDALIVSRMRSPDE